jgi:hypothetical protein
VHTAQGISGDRRKRSAPAHSPVIRQGAVLLPAAAQADVVVAADAAEEGTGPGSSLTRLADTEMATVGSDKSAGCSHVSSFSEAQSRIGEGCLRVKDSSRCGENASNGSWLDVVRRGSPRCQTLGERVSYSARTRRIA